MFGTPRKTRFPCCTFVFVALAATLLTVRASAQADPTARRAIHEIRVGAAYTNANTDEVSQRIGGVTLYASYNVRRHFDLEADVHLVQYLTPQDYGQRSYVAGGRFFYRTHELEPYVKVLGGIGRTIAQTGFSADVPDTGESFGVIEFGGGVDVLLPKHFVGRGEYVLQKWPAFYPNGLNPSLFSIGLTYRFQ